jgi:hypothetical protein
MTAINLTDDPALTDDPEARRLIDAVNDKFDGLRDLVVRAAQLLVAYRQGAPGEGRPSPSARETALADLDQLQGGAEAVRQGILLLFEDATNTGVPSPGTPAQDAEDVARRTIWNDLRSELDRARDEDAVREAVTRRAREAAESANNLVLDALRDALPSYLQVRGMGNIAGDLVARVDEIEAPHLPPVMRAGALARAALNDAWPRVLAAFQAAHDEIEGTGQPVSTLPGFGAAEQIPVQ